MISNQKVKSHLEDMISINMPRKEVLTRIYSGLIKLETSNTGLLTTKTLLLERRSLPITTNTLYLIMA